MSREATFAVRLTERELGAIKEAFNGAFQFGMDGDSAESWDRSALGKIEKAHAKAWEAKHKGPQS